MHHFIFGINFQIHFISLVNHVSIHLMLIWRKIFKKTVSVLYSIVYYYNGAERFEQFLQDGRLYRALILLGLALYYPSVSVFWPSWWGIYIVIFKKIWLHLFLYLLMGWLWPGWLTVVLQCYETVGWVIQPVKSPPKWPMGRVGR